MTNIDNGLNTDCQIINNSGQDVVVLNAVNSATNAANAKPQMIYQQSLTKLALQSNAATLVNGSTDTVTLDESYVDSHGATQKPCLIYELIFADPNTLSPVKNTSQTVVDPFATPMVFPAITVSSADAKQMKDALFFNQTISAYPSSDLAKNFIAALQATNSTLSSATEAAMKTFFLGTVGFTDVDFPSYLAASTYISTFAASWVPPVTNVPYNTDHAIPAHTEQSYWLYSSANMGGGQNGASGASALGRVMFTGSLSGDSTDHNSGFKVYYTNDTYSQPSASGTTLIFDNGQFVDKITDIPGVALQGVWAMKSTFTGDITDLTLWPVLVGTINGTKVFGLPMRPEDGWDKFANFWTTLTFQKVTSSFLTIMGVIMALDFIKTKVAAKIKECKEKKANENKGADPNAAQEAKIKADADSVGQQAQAANEATANRMGTDPATGQPNVQVPTEENLPAAQGVAQAEQIDAGRQAAGDLTQASIDLAEGQVKDLAQYGVDTNLQTAMQNLRAADQNLPAARESGDFTTVHQNLQDCRTNINDYVANNSSVSTEVQENIKTSQTAQEAFEESAQDAADKAKSIEDGDVPEIDPVD